MCRFMGWNSLSVAMTYIHAREEKIQKILGPKDFTSTKFCTANVKRLSSSSADNRNMLMA